MAKRSYDDPEREEQRLEALSLVHQHGDPVLRTPARQVTVFDDALKIEADRMIEVMDSARGVGLAAPQVGRLSRLLVARPFTDEPAYALCNPTIDWRSDEEETDTEGCLSIGEVSVPVTRAVAIRVEAVDIDGEAVTLEADTFEARVLQHEIDHLDGILILDRTTAEARREALRELREGPADAE